MENQNQKGFLPIVLLIIGALVVGGMVYYGLNRDVTDYETVQTGVSRDNNNETTSQQQIDNSTVQNVSSTSGPEGAYISYRKNIETVSNFNEMFDVMKQTGASEYVDGANKDVANLSEKNKSDFFIYYMKIYDINPIRDIIVNDVNIEDNNAILDLQSLNDVGYARLKKENNDWKMEFEYWTRLPTHPLEKETNIDIKNKGNDALGESLKLKKYVNSKYGFEFMYPEKYQISSVVNPFILYNEYNKIETTFFVYDGSLDFNSLTDMIGAENSGCKNIKVYNKNYSGNLFYIYEAEDCDLVHGWYAVALNLEGYHLFILGNTPVNENILNTFKISNSKAFNSFEFVFSEEQKKAGMVKNGERINFIWSGCNEVNDVELIVQSALDGDSAILKTIASNITNKQSFNWLIPEHLPGAIYRVFVSSEQCNSTMETSSRLEIQGF